MGEVYLGTKGLKGAMVMTTSHGGPRDLVREVQQAGLCIGCGACVDLCPYFGHYRGKTVQVFSCDLTEGRCFAHCPKIEVDLDALSRRLRGRPYEGLDLGAYTSIHASRTGAVLRGGTWQGGGTVSALMGFALRSGRIQGAVLTDRDGLWPRPRLVTEEHEVRACAGSKFTAAPTLRILNRATVEGRRDLGVVGTPCQMTAVAQMKGNPLAREDFRDPVTLTVGLFCNWALDPMGLAGLISGRADPGRVTGMDIPPPPAGMLLVRLGDETLEIPLDEVRPLIPKACLTCPDMTSEWADVSVGQFEGRPGWNTLIVRTDAGESLVREAVKAGYLELEPMPEENVRHLSWAAAGKKRRAFQQAAGANAVNREDGFSALRVPDRVLDSVLLGGDDE